MDFIEKHGGKLLILPLSPGWKRDLRSWESGIRVAVHRFQTSLGIRTRIDFTPL